LTARQGVGTVARPEFAIFYKPESCLAVSVWKDEGTLQEAPNSLLAKIDMNDLDKELEKW
jgi:hypothetical protein